jgi:hypothetical protein
MKYCLFLLICFASCDTSYNIKYPTGGRSYLKNVTANDTNFYFLPFKNTETRKDSFYDALQDRFYKLFDEPNLSLKPAAKDIFRFVYTGWKKMPLIILLNDEKIIVKKGVHMGYDGIEYNKEKLKPLEKRQLYMLNMFFPFDTAVIHPLRMKYIDSMIGLYPQLRNTKYFRYLMDKAAINPSELHSTYTTDTIKPTKKEFYKLIKDINASDYWALSFRIKCNYYPDTDGDAFSLEANTKEKYNIVLLNGCYNDHPNFTKACQRLIELAGVGKEYKLISDERTQIVEPDK